MNNSPAPPPSPIEISPPFPRSLHRFLVNKRGEVVERFSSVADPMSAIEPQVAKLLAEGGDATCPPSAS